MAAEPYRRRQSPLVFTLVILAIFGLAVLFWFQLGPHYSLWAVAGFGLVLLLLFWGLSVTVTEEAILLVFGVGIIRRRIPRAEVVAAKAVRNSWSYGFGIRYTPHGWMWNISGLDAVELEYKDGKHFRIGTADPQGLLAALGFAAEGK